MSLSIEQASTSNYLVPAAGRTQAVTIAGVLSATPFVQDWRQFSIDNMPFQPQGVFIDNRAGTGDVVITIRPIGFDVVCPAGSSIQAQFPAPNGQSCSIIGQGQATLVFVDFPVLPSSGLTQISGVVQVAVTGQPVSVQGAVDVAGVPYNVRLSPAAAAPYNASITGAAVSAVIAPVANSIMRRLRLALTGDASLAAAGALTISAVLNGVMVFSEIVHMPAVAGTGAQLYVADYDVSDLAYNVGAGNLTVNISAALATGSLSINTSFA